MLAVTGAIAVMPFTSPPAHPPVVSAETRLVDAIDSVLNIPANLFYDAVNIPANEVQGLDTAAGSLFFNTNIFVVGAANVFGIDPGDPAHVAGIDSLFVPFPGLTDGFGGLNFEISGLLASELPQSASCAVMTCYPIVPPDVITGITGIDRDIGFGEALGSPDFALFRNFFAAPLTGPDSLSTGYYLQPVRRRQHEQRGAGLLRARLLQPARRQLLPRRHRRPGDRGTRVRPDDGGLRPERHGTAVCRPHLHA